MSDRVEGYLVAGGKYHDIDYARSELLKLLAEHPQIRMKVGSDYRDTESIAASRFLVTYTCDVRPSEAEQDVLHDFVQSGGRWLALHATNAALQFTKNGVDSPRVIPKLAFTLGSQFVAHPPIQPYKVECVAPDHPLVKDIGSLVTEDELYMCEYHEREKLTPLLETSYSGKCDGFIEEDWTDSERQLVMYLRPLGDGAVLYNTLGHCRGHYDMVPVMDYYPTIERGSWELPQYYELLRRSIRWCLGEL